MISLRTVLVVFGLSPTALWANGLQPQMAAEAVEHPPKPAVVSLELTPATLKLSGSHDYTQMLVTAHLATGDTADVTRYAHFTAQGAGAEISATGIVTPKTDGLGQLVVEFGGQSMQVPLQVENVKLAPPVDFIRDVNPVMTKLGCNAGTCHGAKEGKYGFKLSLRGYDPLFDVRSLKDDLAGRRLNVASPDDSLMLLKATAGVPHEGGARTKLGDKYYEILRAWVADGAKLNLQASRVSGIEVFPKNPVVQEPGARQQFRIVAHFADGGVRDVTQESFVESGNGDVAAVAPEATGLVKTLRRGEAPVLARYEGNYAATTLTVMGDRTGFTWETPETWSPIDELVAAKWQRMKIQPSGLCSDADFIRRVYLDLTGLPPNSDEVRAFMADATPVRKKRDALVDKLMGSPEFVEHWTNKWSDLLQVNSKFLGEGVTAFRNWIRQEVAANTPYDEFARKILTASGSNHENPAANYWKILRTPAEAMENTTHLFLATRFNCNKCHDHPFERWTQDQYYRLGAYFSQVSLTDDPKSNGVRIGGSAVENSRALYEVVADQPTGDMIHLRTNKVAPPEFPYTAPFGKTGPRRQQLAEWITSPENRYFAASYVNRLWGYLLGAGLIEPLDDIRAGNPPSNPELLEFLTKEFVGAKFDMRHILSLICKSRSYQLAVATNRWNEDDKTNYSHALARRLPAEVLYDSVLKVTGAGSRLPGGVGAQMLADGQTDLPSGFLANTGRPVRESACECERSSDLRLGSVLALLSGPAVSDAIGDAANGLGKLVAAVPDDSKLVEEIFMRVLSRPPTDGEKQKTLANWATMDPDHTALLAKLAAKEAEQAPVIGKAEAERTAGITAAQQELARYTAELAPKLAQLTEKQKTDYAAAQVALRDYEQKNLPASVAMFEKAAPIARTYTGWQPLEVVESRASNGVVLTKQPDGSLLASGPRPDGTDYVIKTDTKIAGITGFMLEVMLSAEEPFFGPGRSGDGNFVLSEFSAKAGVFGTGESPLDLKFSGATADFNQTKFEIGQALDGKRGDGNNGWAISPINGQPHFAAFTLEKPIGDAEKGLRLRFELHQPRAGGYAIAHFRVWATTGAAPVQVGYPLPVVEALRKIPGARSEAEKATIVAYWMANDPELEKRRLAAAKLLQPIPPDPGLQPRQDAIVAASVPIKLDPSLVQLRADVEMSKTQAANKRLTGTQDLVWALVNNPSFLFNR